MLVDGACSIYAHRPRTCRVYDCRVFAAAGVEPEGDDERGAGGAGGEGAAIARQARRWRFDHHTPDDDARHAAVRAAAEYVAARAHDLPGVPVSLGATRRAVLAVEVHDAFLGTDPETGALVVAADPPPSVVEQAIARRAGRRPARWRRRRGATR